MLLKSLRRDPRAIGYGRFALLDIETGEPIHPVPLGRGSFPLTVFEVERLLMQDPATREAVAAPHWSTPEGQA
jgi:hypothetical protein